MKIYLLILILFSHFASAQSVNFQLFEDAAYHEFEKLDEIMLKKHQFIRIDDSEEKNQRIYINNQLEKDLAIVLTVIEANKTCENIVTAVVGKLRNLYNLKKDIIESGYVFHGEKSLGNEIKLLHYIKNNAAISITKEVTNTGAYQILFTCK